MEDFSRFRSALNGFNRSDVAAYIEQISQTHTAALNEEKKNAENLARDLSDSQDALLKQSGRVAALEKELAQAEQEKAAMKEKLAQTEQALHATEEALEEALSMVPAPAEEPEQPTTPDYENMELEAYRRAEAMERTATERAARLQQQLADLLEQISSRYEEAGQEIGVLTADIRTNLTRLEDTLSDLDVIFDEATDSFRQFEGAEAIAAE